MSFVRILPVVGLVLLLGACDSAEERAERHFANALALLSEGDVDRATVEFRNVFRLNGRHRDARAEFAALLRREGQITQSFSQYLRLVEQFPDDFEGQLALAEMAVDAQNWEAVKRHGTKVLELSPEDPRAKVIDLAMRYQAALGATDPSQRRILAREAEALLPTQPHASVLRYILIDAALFFGDPETALAQLDEVIALAPDRREFHAMRLAVLGQLDRPDAVETQILEMIERFPDDESNIALLLQFYERQADFGKAEAFLRQRAKADLDDIGRQQSLLRFVGAVRGPEAVLSELDGIIAERPGSVVFARLRAETKFAAGDHDAAIAEIDAMVDEAEASHEIRAAKVSLARMLVLSGNPAAAQQRINEVLAEDPTEVEALKMRSAWLIDSDEADHAISVLRTVLDLAPRDVDAMTLMARAHTRNGNHELARDFLSLAVEASNSAPEESIRFANVLMNEGRNDLAEGILTAALRRAPRDLAILGHMGRLYVLKKDWARLGLLEKTLRAQESQDAARVADGLETTRLAAQDRADDAIALLENLAKQSRKGDANVHLAVIRARLISGDAAGAIGHAEKALEANPDNIDLRLALASTHFVSNNLVAAEAAYRGLIRSDDQVEQAWTGLVRTKSEAGDSVGARATLEEALQAMPQALNLLWAKASFLEQDSNIEGAIEVYETLYDRASGSPILANNLASLLSNHREDQQSLERAFSVARRLRGTEFPPFQDTYGWIALRRGNIEEALAYLRPAAAAITDDPVVQFHLGMALVAAGQEAEALEQLRRAVKIAGPNNPPAQIAIAKAEIDRLEAAVAKNSEILDD